MVMAGPVHRVNIGTDRKEWGVAMGLGQRSFEAGLEWVCFVRALAFALGEMGGLERVLSRVVSLLQ